MYFPFLSHRDLSVMPLPPQRFQFVNVGEVWAWPRIVLYTEFPKKEMRVCHLRAECAIHLQLL